MITGSVEHEGVAVAELQDGVLALAGLFANKLDTRPRGTIVFAVFGWVRGGVLLSVG